MKFIRLFEHDGSWLRFLRDWQNQCERLNDDFDLYQVSPISVVEDLVRNEPRVDAGVFGLEDDEGFHAICQVNCANLPGYSGRVLRVRMMYFAPSYDVGERNIEAYAEVLVRMFNEVLKLSDEDMRAPHIKFHLRSPADQRFFSELSAELDKLQAFASVEMLGSWLYITKK
jgi:hypothetical protein